MAIVVWRFATLDGILRVNRPLASYWLAARRAIKRKARGEHS